AEILNQPLAKVPESWRAAWANEKAGLTWHEGDLKGAAAQWQTLEGWVPAQFNLGMASLFLNRPPKAHSYLKRAVAHLAENSAWYHLGQIYLALADSRK